MRILKSKLSPLALPQCSTFTFVFPTPDRLPPDQPCFIDADTGFVLTRRATRDLALSLAYGLTSPPLPQTLRETIGAALQPTRRGLPLRVGQVVLLFAPNGLSFPLAYFALAAAGLRTTPANVSYTPRELAHQLRDSRADLALVHPSLLPVLEKAWREVGVGLEEARRRTVLLDWTPDAPRSSSIPGWTSVNELMHLGKLEKEVAFDGERAHETVLMCYSSGTTGLAKSVETTHYNVTSCLTLARPLLTYTSDEVILGVLPFYHMYAVAKLVQYFPTFGVPVVIMPGYTPDGFCAAIARFRITTALVVPPILLALAKHPSTEQHDMRSLRKLFSAAAPLSPSLVVAATKRLVSVGCNAIVSQGYGLTETSPTVTLLTDADALRKLGSVGELLPNLEARIVKDGSGEADAADGEPGELWVRGPTIMKGYLHNPAATRAVITRDGFFKTGDVFSVDAEGHYTIVDRKKELIKYKAFQVPPAELEGVLITHPDVADAAVIGVYALDEETELPRAYIAHAAGPGALPSAEAKARFALVVQSWVAQRVAKHKYLRGGVIVVDVVPKSAAGKILRRELRELYRRETGRDPLTGQPVDKAKL